MNFPSKYISAGQKFAKLNQPVPAPYVYKRFNVDSEILCGTIVIGTPGFYRLWINGHEITRGHMAPYIANPDENVYFDEYEITQYLRKRDNVIGILLGNGMQNNWGGFVWNFEQAPWRGAPKVAFCATVTLQNGETVTAESDLDCMWHESPIQWDDERMGECYDARFEVPGWNYFGDFPRSWLPVTWAPAPKGTPRLNRATPIRTECEIKPVAIIPTDDGYIYDFGVNYTGITRLKVKGTRGQVIEILHGEIVHDGKFYQKNLYFDNKESYGAPNYVQKVIYVCAGAREEIYEPSFCYFGMRYAKVTGIVPEQATEDLLTFVVKHTDLESAGTFTSDNDVLNALQAMTLRSDLSNFWYFPTDCPHREKNGWTGDAALSCEQFYVNFKPGADLRQWTENIRSAMLENGDLPGIVPTQKWGYTIGPCWDSVLTLIPYYHYRFTGDLTLAQENAEAIDKQMHWFASLAEENGFIFKGLSDWCAPNHPNPYCKGDFLRTTAASVAAGRAAYLFGLLGEKEKEQFAADLSQRLRENVRKRFIDAKTGLINFEGHSGPALALYYNVCDKNEEKAIFDDLVKRIEASNYHLDVGVFGLRAVFHVLSAYGRTDLALRVITDTDCPSYGAWVKDGMTTLCEAPQGIQAVNGKGEFAPDSLNHHFMGDISSWMIQDLAGLVINPTLQDANSFVIKPHIVPTLGHVSASHDFPAGKVDVAWEVNGNEATVTINADTGVHGTFEAADGWTPVEKVAAITCGTTVIRLKK